MLIDALLLTRPMRRVYIWGHERSVRLLTQRSPNAQPTLVNCSPTALPNSIAWISNEMALQRLQVSKATYRRDLGDLREFFTQVGWEFDRARWDTGVSQESFNLITRYRELIGRYRRRSTALIALYQQIQQENHDSSTDRSQSGEAEL